MIKFSVVMPSYMGSYASAASNRETKIIRAIESVCNQTYKNWELIIIADGCQRTIEIIKQWYETQENKELPITVYKIQKQRLWGGIRNVGIEKATDDYIIYLDIDDVYLPEYLQELANKMTDNKDWYWCNDIKMKGNTFIVDYCDVNKLGQCGTSNVIHKREMKSRWIATDYGEDWQFIKALKKESSNYRFVSVAGYKICHVPRKYDV